VESWDIVYYRDADDNVPAVDFLVGCPTKTRANLLAVLNAVAAAPPPAFSGGGKWEAMHGTMGGYYEVRAMGPGREHFRLFCILDKGDEALKGLPRDAIAVIAGGRKPNATLFDEFEYAKVRTLGDDYKAQLPRRIAS
jgi:hypothetical protein